MNATICPTITVQEPYAYREQLEKVTSFAARIHVDLSDGMFTPVQLIDVDNVWWPSSTRVDIHVMYKKPSDCLHALIALQPQLVVMHAEAEGDFSDFANTLHHHGIEAGVALLPQTGPEVLEQAIESIDHVLIFSGNLGYYGGQADLELVSKIEILRRMKPQIEIGWDGGINDQNVELLANAGVDVLNVGGYIAKAPDPSGAYATLKALANNANHG